MTPEGVLAELLLPQAVQSATSLGLTCQPAWPRGFPTCHRFGEFWYRTESVKRPTAHKAGKALTIGLLQFTIYSPERFGKGYSLPFAQKLKSRFEKGEFSRGDYLVQLDPRTVFELPRPHMRHVITIVDCTFDYFHPGEQSITTRQSLCFSESMGPPQHITRTIESIILASRLRAGAGPGGSMNGPNPFSRK